MLALAASTPHRLSMGGSQTRPCTDRPRFGPSHRRSSRRIARHERSPQPASGWGGRSALHKHVIHVQSASRPQGCCWAEGCWALVRGERFRAKRCCMRELVTTRRAAAHLIIGSGTDRGAAASSELRYDLQPYCIALRVAQVAVVQCEPRGPLIPRASELLGAAPSSRSLQPVRKRGVAHRGWIGHGYYE